MRHIVLLVCTISLNAGFASLIAWIFLYLKYKDIRVKNLIFLLLTMTASIFGNSFYNYYSINGLNIPIIWEQIVGVLMVITGGFQIYIVPLFIYSMVNVEYKKYLRIFFFSAGVATTFIFVISIFILSEEMLRNIFFPYFVLLAVQLTYYVVYGIVKSSVIKNPEIRKAFRDFIICTFIYIPFEIFDELRMMSRLSYNAINLFNMIAFPIYYLTINVVAVIRIAKTFTEGSNIIEKEEIKVLEVCDNLNKYFTEMNVTSREREIILMIVDGETNRSIADKLFLSAKTIDNHVYNIYKKTGVKSRMELANIVKSQ